MIYAEEVAAVPLGRYLGEVTGLVEECLAEAGARVLRRDRLEVVPGALLPLPRPTVRLEVELASGGAPRAVRVSASEGEDLATATVTGLRKRGLVNARVGRPVERGGSSLDGFRTTVLDAARRPLAPTPDFASWGELVEAAELVRAASPAFEAPGSVLHSVVAEGRVEGVEPDLALALHDLVRLVRSTPESLAVVRDLATGAPAEWALRRERVAAS